jgi:hypothetical protein
MFLAPFGSDRALFRMVASFFNQSIEVDAFKETPLIRLNLS